MTTIATQSPAWWDLVGKWRQKAAQFDQAYSALLAQRPDPVAHPNLAAQWRHLVASGQATRSRITEIANALASVSHAFSNASDALSRNPVFDAVAKAGTSAWDWLKKETGLGDLGFLPVLITAGVIAASLAAITYWITQAHELSVKLAAVQKLESQGMTPAAAAQAVQGLAPASSGFSLIGGSAGKYLALGAAGVALFLILRGRHEN